MGAKRCGGGGGGNVPTSNAGSTNVTREMMHEPPNTSSPQVLVTLFLIEHLSLISFSFIPLNPAFFQVDTAQQPELNRR
jgi:hypothetical protein